MEESLVDDIITLHKQGNWLEVIEKYHSAPERNKLLWVYPSKDNLKFIKTSVDNFLCTDIVSVGCGSGLLEWIITQATGIPTKGIEVDGTWWESKYAPPCFIPLHICHKNLNADMATQQIFQVSGRYALLFCYFNNERAFYEYLSLYRGPLLIIIGPGPYRGTHTNPAPLKVNLDPEWRLCDSQEVRDSKDFIAVYCR